MAQRGDCRPFDVVGNYETPLLEECPCPGGTDQGAAEMRHDVLVYTSPPLEKGLEVTGPLELVLYVSSSARDTDFTGKLVDVYPDGTAYNVQEGILRARYREGFDKKVWMKEREVYEVRVDLAVTSNFFRPGHREGVVPSRVKELARLKIAELNGCDT